MIAGIVLYFLFGLALVGYALARRPALNAAVTPAQTERWTRRVAAWGLTGNAATRQRVAADLQRSSRILNGTVELYGGLGIVIGGVASALFVLHVPYNPYSPSDAVLGAALLAGPALVGLGWGAERGIGHIRRVGAHGRGYGDLRPRYSDDYRAPLFPVVTAILLAGFIGGTVVVGARIEPGLRILSYSTFNLETVPYHWWQVACIPAIMLVVALVVEVQIARLVRLPRLLITPDVEEAWRADEMLRARQINAAQAMQWIVLGSLASAQVRLLGWNIPRDSPAPTVLGLCANLLFFVGVCLLPLSGRLGGHTTGWPWR